MHIRVHEFCIPVYVGTHCCHGNVYEHSPLVRCMYVCEVFRQMPNSYVTLRDQFVVKNCSIRHMATYNCPFLPPSLLRSALPFPLFPLLPHFSQSCQCLLITIPVMYIRMYVCMYACMGVCPTLNTIREVYLAWALGLLLWCARHVWQYERMIFLLPFLEAAYQRLVKLWPYSIHPTCASL